MIDRIMYTLEEKDIETKKHINSVLEMAMKIVISMKLDYTELKKLRLIALFHDIGKSAIYDNILLKKGTLSREEYIIAQNHVQVGYKIATIIE
jgi:putative nucleotidyltransferase with HDIG domain